MNNNVQRERDFDFTGVFSFLWRYRFILLIVVVIAALGGVIFSMPFFIPPKYDSTVVLYPATTNSISKAIMSTNSNSQEDLLEFGKEEEAEQLLQILQSDAITKRVAEKYDLREHYRIPEDVEYPQTKLKKEFKKNISYRRTEYMSIEIIVLDESRDTAALIANDIAAFVDSIKNRVQRQRAIDAYKIVQQKYNEKFLSISENVDSLARIGELGVFNYEQQSAVLSEQYNIALKSENQKLIKGVERQMVNLGKYGPAHQSLFDKIRFENEELALLKTKLEEAKVDAEEILPATFIINYATPAEKKAYPIRSLIVLVSALSAFVLAVVVLIFFEQYKYYQANEGSEMNGLKFKKEQARQQELVNL